MDHQDRINQYEASARREDDAARSAATAAAATLHRKLADMLRREALRIRSVSATLKIAFGD